MKNLSRIAFALLLTSALLSAPLAAQDVDWNRVKSVWNTLTPSEQASYMEMYRNDPTAGGPGTATAFGRPISPSSLVPGDTCGAATNEISALPFGDSGDTSALINDYDIVASATCNTGFDSTGPEIAYMVQTDITCDVTVTETAGTYDVVLWAVTNCADPDNTCVGSSDGGNPENFTFTAAAGTDYFVLVDGWSGQGGAYTLDISESTATGCALVPVELQSLGVQ